MTRRSAARRAALLWALLPAALASCGPDDVPAAGARPEQPPPPPFEELCRDATAASGVAFVHHTGGYGEKLLPETMGSGACVLDADGDGALDVFLVDSGGFPGHPAAADARCALFLGAGDATFRDASEERGAALALYGMGASAADADADGDTDVYVTALGENAWLRNDGARFREAAAGAGLTGGSWTDEAGNEHPDWSTSSAWFDADGDGDLDLFVANYCRWTPELEIFTTLDGRTKAFTTPDRYVGLPCRLLRNAGDGTFEPAGPEAGLEPHLGKALGVALWDFGDDGRLDVVVANDTRPNFLFANEGGGRFTERGAELGLAYDENGRARAGMGIDVADYANDGVPAVAIGNFAGEPLSLWREAPDGGFRSVAGESGVTRPSLETLAFGLAFLDLDLDGLQDLVVLNGHIEPDVARFVPDQAHAQPMHLFRGLPGGGFQDASTAAGRAFTTPRVGRGLAAGDLDGDGDLDLVLTTNGGPAAVLVNEARDRGTPHWLRVSLRGAAPNTDAIGARIELEAGGTRQLRVVRTGSSYLSQSDLAPVFGLGETDRVDALRVRWPGGRVVSYDVEGVDRTLVLVEGPD